MTSHWTESDRPRPPGSTGLPMQQHPAYGATCRALGTETLWLEWREGPRVLGSAQVLSRRWPLLGRFALVSRGPVFAPDVPADAAKQALAALVDGLAHSHRGVMLTPERIDGMDLLERSGLLTMVTAGHVARLSLASDVETLRAGLHQKWRNRLKRAETARLRVTSGSLPDDPGHWLLTAEAAQARTRRYARLPPAFSLAWARNAQTLLMTASDRCGPVAGMLFLIHGPWASYHVGWTSREGRAANAHTLLMWQAILSLRSRGLAALELGTLDTVKTPDLARFKLGTGATPVSLGSTWLRAPGSRAIARLGA